MCKTAYPEWWPMKRADREEKGKLRKRKRKKERRKCWRDSEKRKPQKLTPRRMNWKEKLPACRRNIILHWIQMN
jgi:hypothetical protein